jgi:hypothetical protein
MRGVEESDGAAALAALPYVDEHAYEVAASAGETWAALLIAVERSFGGARVARVAGLLGCEDANGFHVAVERPPGEADPASGELALAGRHRFSRYALIFRVDPLAPDRSRVRAETRAEFPGLKGSVYRALVIGTRGHVLVTRRILAAVKRLAERSAAA